MMSATSTAAPARSPRPERQTSRPPSRHHQSPASAAVRTPSASSPRIIPDSEVELVRVRSRRSHFGPREHAARIAGGSPAYCRRLQLPAPGRRRTGFAHPFSLGRTLTTLHRPRTRLPPRPGPCALRLLLRRQCAPRSAYAGPDRSIIPGSGISHAVAERFVLRRQAAGKIFLVNHSGRGDKTPTLPRALPGIGHARLIGSLR